MTLLANQSFGLPNFQRWWKSTWFSGEKAKGFITHSRAGSMSYMWASVSLAPQHPLGAHRYGCHEHSGSVSQLRYTVFRKPQPYKGLPENLSKLCPRGRHCFLLSDWETHLSIGTGLSSKAICYLNVFEMIVWNKRCVETWKTHGQFSSNICWVILCSVKS